LGDFTLLLKFLTCRQNPNKLIHEKMEGGGKCVAEINVPLLQCKLLGFLWRRTLEDMIHMGGMLLI
jgi:hypothetical protein